MTTPNSTSGIKSTAFGHWLREHRDALDLTREELADRVGCSSVTIYKIEIGARRPSRQIAHILAELLHIPVDEREPFIAFARGQSAIRNPQSAIRSDAPWQALQRKSTNLPAPVTPLIGRQQEVEQVCNLLLRDAVRLVTLTGPPGIGKTRLALKVAKELVNPQSAIRNPQLEDGAFFVPLAPILDPSLVVAAVAKTLEVKEAGDRPLLDTVTEFLRDKYVLLVLDNFEQVVEAGPQVAQLMAGCPWLKVLVTSREALHLYGERLYPVPPLALPDMAQLPDVGTLSRYSSITFFVESAQAVKPDFSLTEENAEAVARICAHLGGLPLAIELAAARTRLFSPQALLEMLTNSLSLLTGGARDLPPRQQTLRGAIDWSYNLLNDGEQKLFRRLGVFVGGSTLVAKEAVCNSKGDIPGGAASVVESLLNKSLLQQVEATEDNVRFYMLEMIHEYAVERLEDSGEAESIKRLHAEYYLTMAEVAELEWVGPSRAEWLDRLERERHNLRAALHWTRERGDITMALRMVAALHGFWLERGYISEGRDEAEATLSLADGYDTADHARVLFAAARFARMQSDYAAAHLFSQQSLETARRLGNDAAGRKALADALRGLALVAKREGNYVLARQYGEEYLAVHEASGDERGVASALLSLGSVALYESNYERARHYYEAALEKAHKIGEKGKTGSACVNLGLVAQAQGDNRAARSLHEEALAIFREMGSKPGIATALNNLGDVARYEDNHGQAMRYYAESIALYRELGDKGAIGGCLLSISGIWSGLAQPERAAQLLGAAESLLTGVGYQLLPTDRFEYERTLAMTRETLGEEAFEAARKQGSAMTMAQAITHALAP